MALRAFFDESAMGPKDGPFMIMAGFAGTVSSFEKAADSWQECLDESPAVPYFHYREGMGTDRIPSLAKVIGEHILQGFIVTIPHAPFHNRDRKLVKGMFGTRIYDWAFVHTVMGVLTWVDKKFPEGEKVDFIFEKRRELELCQKNFYAPFSVEGKGLWKRAGTCTPEEDKKVAALQMSDLLAGEALDSIRLGKQSEVITNLARARPLFLLNKRPHPVIERSMALHALGKKLFDAGRKKILASPKDAVDPAVYEKEYWTLRAISAIAMQDNAMLRRELEEWDEDTAE